ncbi:MAG: selenocysteine-specific translation elongation factor [Candidatus Krumholzibacteriia bacterium]
MANRRFILGTAGHVDHGKTQLVSRLTGWDTDRLREEKERGISIELGFAPLHLDEDTAIGIIDVPGHERFVKNMVSGAGGIDLALLVIAADEGVMPQTREHLEVLRSLAIEYGVVVISKSDLATDDVTAIVTEDISELLRGSFLENAPVVHTSARTGEGFEELKRVLKHLCERIPERDTGGSFRLAVDRVFHKQGIGVVVTGSCYSGTVTVGDSLVLMPAGKKVRVREIQSFGEKRRHGYAGERLAIALQGGKLGEVSRGDMLTAPGRFVVSYMLDARVHIAAYANFELKQRERIRLHHGAREVLGRVVLLEDEILRSGDDGLIQFRLESPIVAGEGDLVVIRKYSPSRVLGGGRIIVPVAAKHKRGDREVIDTLLLREAGDPGEKALKAILDRGLHGSARDAMDETIVEALAGDGEVLAIGGVVFHSRIVETLGGRVRKLATSYVDKHPLRRGMDKEELRQKVAFPHPPPLFNKVLEVLAASHAISIRDNLVCPESQDGPPAEMAGEIDALRASFRRAGLAFPGDEELRASWGGRSELGDVLQYLRDDGSIRKISDGAYVDTDALRGCVQELDAWFEGHSELAVGDFKDLFGVTRKHAIPLLEYFDHARMTVREGNARVRGPRLVVPDASSFPEG